MTTDNKTAATKAHEMAEPNAGMLPAKLLKLIGEYGHAKRERHSDVEALHRWENLIDGIKAYAADRIAAPPAPESYSGPLESDPPAAGGTIIGWAMDGETRVFSVQPHSPMLPPHKLVLHSAYDQLRQQLAAAETKAQEEFLRGEREFNRAEDALAGQERAVEWAADWREAYVLAQSMRYCDNGMAIAAARIHAENDANTAENMKRARELATTADAGGAQGEG